MKILGISALYHDSAASIIEDGKIIAASQEERFTRIKNDASFPIQSIKFCLEQAKCSIDDLDALVFYDKPLLKFERQLESFYAMAPKGIKLFLKFIPIWIKEKLFLKNLIRKELENLGKYDKKKLKILFTEHHLSHQASTFFTSGFQESAILTIDGVGEWATASLAFGTGKKITVLKELNFPHSLGLLYSSFTYFLGFKVNSGEYKLMGLAPYGDENSKQFEKFKLLISDELISIKSDGSIWMNHYYFNFISGLEMIKTERWEKLFGIKKIANSGEKNEDSLTMDYCNLALAIQRVTEEVVILMARECKRITNSDNLCLAGGVALNCVANGKLEAENLFKNIYIQPASGDAGGSLGAALAGYYIYFNQSRNLDSNEKINQEINSMQGSYLGQETTEDDIIKVIKKYTADYEILSPNELSKKVAKLISEGNIVGWVQGRAEFGPRALGNRSILADPRNPETQKNLNLKIKYRESFRPFAPIIKADKMNEYFDSNILSPYMLMVYPLKLELRKQLPKNYNQLALMDKLYFQRSNLPAITHVDFSARVQSLEEQLNPKMYKLLSDFEELTKLPILVNTSFNVRGEPIVNTPLEAFNCFMNTEMDYLVLNNFLFDKKKQQPSYKNENWKKEFKLD